MKVDGASSRQAGKVLAHKQSVVIGIDSSVQAVVHRGGGPPGQKAQGRGQRQLSLLP